MIWMIQQEPTPKSMRKSIHMFVNITHSNNSLTFRNPNSKDRKEPLPAQNYSLTCKCGRKSCYHCIILFLDEINQKKKLKCYLERSSQWYRDEVEFKESGGQFWILSLASSKFVQFIERYARAGPVLGHTGPTYGWHCFIVVFVHRF